jgi:anti-anti-sigma factor
MSSEAGESDEPLLCSVDVGPDDFTVGVEFLPDRTLLWAAGELDLLTADWLAAEIDEHLLGGKARGAVLDLRAITFIDCQAVGMLVEKARRAHSLGIELRLEPGPTLRRLNDRLERHSLGRSARRPIRQGARAVRADPTRRAARSDRPGRGCPAGQSS